LASQYAEEGEQNQHIQPRFATILALEFFLLASLAKKGECGSFSGFALKKMNHSLLLLAQAKRAQKSKARIVARFAVDIVLYMAEWTCVRGLFILTRKWFSDF
jgi:hypothetical protein